MIYAGAMVRSIRALRETPDEELIDEHDQHAESTVVGTQYYLDELNRRAQQRSVEAADRLARRAFWLTIANTAFALVAAVAAMIALCKG
jgi:CHASE3 domain sensor protein